MNRTPYTLVALVTALALTSGLTVTSGQATATPATAAPDQERTTPYPVRNPP